MTRRAWRGALLALTLAAAPALADGDAAPAVALQEVVSSWLACREAIQQVQDNWQAERRVLEEETRFLAGERRRLAAATAPAATAADPEPARERVTAEAALAQVAAAVAKAEAVLVLLEPRLPPLFTAGQRQAFARLRQRVADHASRPPAATETVARLQALLDLLAAAERFDREVSAGRLLLIPPGGREQEVEVIFLGLAAGYAVSADGSRAAVGYPGPKAWEWRWEGIDPASVRAALDAHAGGTTGFVRLPVQLRGGQTP